MERSWITRHYESLVPLKGTLFAKVKKWVADGNSSTDDGGGDWEITNNILDANIVTSKVHYGNGTHGKHKVVLDIDHPAVLVPSTTEGHFHLYIDVDVDQDYYWRVLDAMDDAGILEHGYVEASKKRGFTAVRLPWIKKEARTGYGA